MRGASVGALRAGLGALAVVIAVGLAAALAPVVDYPTGHGDQAAKRFTVVPAASTVSGAAVARLQWSSARDAVAPAALDGVVTSVDLAAGGAARCGAAILHVNGLPIVAYCGAFPLWRDISAATTGPDRAEVVAFLREVGLLDGTAAPSDEAFGAALGQFASTALEAAEPVLPAARTIWIGSSLRADDVLVAIGDLVTGGQALVRERADLLAAVVSPLPSVVGVDAAFAPSTGADPVKVGADGGVQALEALAAAVRSTVVDDPLPTSIDGRVVLTLPDAAVSVPLAAIVGDDRQHCVLSADGAAIDVEVLWASDSGAIVVGEVASGDTVLAAKGHEACSP